MGELTKSERANGKARKPTSKRPRKDVQLCPPTCVKYHSKQFVADLFGVHVSTVYVYTQKGLQTNRHGMIYCPWIRQYYENKKNQ